MTTTINGTEYALSTTLRVAYKVQGQHNHKAYTEVFEGLGAMPLEQQIAIIYASFQCANPDQAKFITQQQFLDYYLDNYTLKQMMDQIEYITKGIMGVDAEAEDATAEQSQETAQAEDVEGN